MTKKLRKPLSIILSLMMILSVFTIIPVTSASAAEETITVHSNTDKLSNHGIQNLQYGEHLDFDGTGLPWGTFIAPAGKVFTKIVSNGAKEGAINWTGSADRVNHDNMVGEWYIDWETDTDGFRPFTISFTLADAAPPTYTVTWKNYDGSVLETDADVAEGATPEYNGNEPTKPEDDENTYEFAGWTPDIAEVTADAEYTATFTAVPKQAAPSYVKVTEDQQDWSGDYLIVYEDGSKAFNGSADELNASGNTIDVTISDGKIESNADTDAAKVTIDQIDGGYSIATAKGVYIGGRSGNNTLVSSDSVIVNTISLEDDSAKIVSNSTTLQYNSSWGGFRYYKSVNQKSVQLYKLTGAAAPATYTVTWKNWDGSVLETDEDVAEGATPEYNGNEPTKPDSNSNTYTFDRWTPEVSAVTGDTEYTATFTEASYYIIGTMNNWTVDDAYKLTKNEGSDVPEYSLSGLDLTTESQFKIVSAKTADGGLLKWFPDPGDNYGANGEITDDAKYTVYFRPDYNGGDDWFCNAIYVAMDVPEESQAVISMIEALPAAQNVTTADAQDIASARAAYDALTPLQQTFIDDNTLAKLTAAETALAAAQDNAAADEVTQMIADLPDPQNVTVDDGDDIEAAMAAYLSLTADQIVLVPEASVTRLEEIVNAYADAAQAAADQEAADEVTQMIANLPDAANVTANDAQDIADARAAYAALSDAQKALVDANTLAKLEAAEKMIADLNAAAEVTAMINALPDPQNVTVNDKDQIKAASDAYSALTSDQTKLVDEEVFNRLVDVAYAYALAVKAAEDQAAADYVTNMINNLPAEVTANDALAITAAREEYDDLTNDQKALIDADTLAKLEAAEAALEAATRTYDKVNANDASCTSNGNIEYYVGSDGKFYSDDQGTPLDDLNNDGVVDINDTIIPATPHEYVETIVQPKNGEQGYLLHTCSVCQHSYKDNFFDTALKNKSYIETKAQVGETVYLYGDAEGGVAGYTYAFMYRKISTGTWTKIGKKYGTATSAKFTPGKATKYIIMINVKDSIGKIKSKTFTLDLSNPLVNNTTVNAETVKVGEKIVLKGAASGGIVTPTNGYKYAFYYKKSRNTDWIEMKPAYTTKGASVRPKTAQSYDVKSVVMDAEGNTNEVTYTVNVTK